MIAHQPFSHSINRSLAHTWKSKQVPLRNTCCFELGNEESEPWECREEWRWEFGIVIQVFTQRTAISLAQDGRESYSRREVPALSSTLTASTLNIPWVSEEGALPKANLWQTDFLNRKTFFTWHFFIYFNVNIENYAQETQSTYF